MNIFFQGYDRSLSFIITQDPLESTVVEFWRMIKEQSITTLVMLSELGEGQVSKMICCYYYYYFFIRGTIYHLSLQPTCRFTSLTFLHFSNSITKIIFKYLQLIFLNQIAYMECSMRFRCSKECIEGKQFIIYRVHRKSDPSPTLLSQKCVGILETRIQ